MDALHAWDLMLLTAIARGAIVLAIAGLLLALAGRRMSAAARHAVWLMALVALVFASKVPAGGVRWRLELPRLPARSAQVVPESEHSPGAPVAAGQAAAPQTAAPRQVEPSGAATPVQPMFATTRSEAPALEAPAPVQRRPWILWLWLSGAVLALLGPLSGTLRARRWIARAQPASEALRNEWLELAAGTTWRARLCESEHAPVPMTWGVFRAVVLVPRGFADWPAAARRAALRHELAHVRRGDWLAQALARVVAALHWIDPLAWLALRRLRCEAEHACDDAALAGDSSGADYADQLLWVARGLGRARTPVGVVAMARVSLLEDRVRALLDPRVTRAVPGPGARVLGWLAVFVLAGVLSQTEVACAGTERVSEPTAVVTVAPDGSADHTSIQAAIDAAPAGALVRIAPGTYEEHLVVDKALTLAGERWETTLVTYPMTSALDRVAGLAIAMNDEMRAATSNEEKLAIRDRYSEAHGPWPVLRVRGDGPVRVTGLQFRLTGEREEGKIAQFAALWLEGDDVVVEDCGVTDSPGSGIGVLRGRRVEIRDSLVAGVANVGIGVMGDELGAPPTVLISNCEVRNCVHRGISVGKGNRSTRIEGCRISGSQWHGIRYDDAAPEIVGNRISGNARGGIYASGETEGVVRDNLFQANGMTGASFCLGGRDLVERNTFVGDQRSGIEVLGAAAPVIRNNVFFRTPQGVKLTNAGGKDPRAASRNDLTFEGNLFHEVDEMLVPAGLRPEHSTYQRLMQQAEEDGNRELDPGFVDAEAGDFRLAESAPALALDVGAVFSDVLFANPDPAAPTAPEERAQVTAVVRQEAQQRQDAERDLYQWAILAAEPWIEGLMQIDDAARRAATFDVVRDSLGSTERTARYAALMALSRTGEVNLDRESLRPRLVEMVRSESGGLQAQAMFALLTLQRTPDDCEFVRSLLRADPESSLRGSSIRFLAVACDRDFSGATGELVLELLRSSSDQQLGQHWASLWGVTSSEALQAWMLERSREPHDWEARHRAIYYGLSTSPNKSPAVVERLIEALGSAHGDDSERAIWGLTFGVAPEAQGPAADAALEFFRARSGAGGRDSALRVLSNYGSAKHLPALRELADNQLLPEEQREQVRRALRAIEARDSD